MRRSTKGNLGIDQRAGRYATLLAGLDPDELLTFGELADEIECSEVTVKAFRKRGLGPKFFKAGLKAVRVRRGDVVIWLKDRDTRFAATHPHIPVPIR